MLIINIYVKNTLMIDEIKLYSKHFIFNCIFPNISYKNNKNNITLLNYVLCRTLNTDSFGLLKKIFYLF